jgi:predicted RNA-binding protein Jag
MSQIEEQPAPATSTQTTPERRALALRVVGEILQHMEAPSRLEGKEAPDGGIAIAVYPETPLAGVQAGKRSHVVDAIQFLANKICNRGGSDKRWITLGVGGFPEPRAAQQPAKRQEPAPRPAAAPAAAPRAPAARAASPSSSSSDERTLEVGEDAELSAAARSMAEKAAGFGRYFAIVPMTVEDRARVLKATAGVPGVKVSVEGEGRNRRVVFTPEKPQPMPKKKLPDYGEDEDED